MGTPASVRTPGLPLPSRAPPGTRSGAILVPTRAPLRITWRSMTATQAGQPAKDPDDGAPGGADVDGTTPTDAGQADVGQVDAVQANTGGTSVTRLTYGERAGGT